MISAPPVNRLLTAAVLATVAAGAPLTAQSQVPTVALSAPKATIGEPFSRVAGLRVLSDGRLLVADPTTFKVTVVEPEDAYSMWVEFASQRVHMTNNIGAIFADGFESSDTGAWSATLP